MRLLMGMRVASGHATAKSSAPKKSEVRNFAACRARHAEPHAGENTEQRVGDGGQGGEQTFRIIGDAVAGVSPQAQRCCVVKTARSIYAPR